MRLLRIKVLRRRRYDAAPKVNHRWLFCHGHSGRRSSYSYNFTLSGLIHYTTLSWSFQIHIKSFHVVLFVGSFVFR